MQKLPFGAVLGLGDCASVQLIRGLSDSVGSRSLSTPSVAPLPRRPPGDDDCDGLMASSAIVCLCGVPAAGKSSLARYLLARRPDKLRVALLVPAVRLWHICFDEVFLQLKRESGSEEFDPEVWHRARKRVLQAVETYFGDKVGASTKGTRKDALAEELGVELAFDATMETLQEPEVFAKLLIMAGDFMFAFSQAGWEGPAHADAPQNHHPPTPEEEMPNPFVSIIRLEWFSRFGLEGVEELKLVDEGADSIAGFGQVMNKAIDGGAEVSIICPYDPKDIGLF